MSDQNTSTGCLRAAFQALLRGDADVRDRLCARAKILLEAEHQANEVAKVMSVDFYITGRGVATPTLAMAKAAGAIQ